MQQRKIDIWVGLFVLFGVAAVIALTLSVGAAIEKSHLHRNRQFRGHRHVKIGCAC